MKTLALHGHRTRGKEVIEILEMLGGVNKATLSGNGLYVYYIDNNNNRIDLSSILQDRFIDFHLEDFLEKYPFKVGDKVQHRWSTSCGSIYMVEDILWEDDQIKYIICNPHCKTHKSLVIAKNIRLYKDLERKYPELRMDPDDEDKLATEVTFCGNKILPPDDYLIGKVTEVEDGLLVEFVKKQSQYPKTYKECCDILGCKANDFYTEFGYNNCNVEVSYYEDKVDDLLQLFRKLIYCRDAYWKIIGEEMGLSAPWKPDWGKADEKKYCIVNTEGNITKWVQKTTNKILAFPTEKIRDIFYENFKDLIEKCKEFL